MMIKQRINITQNDEYNNEKRKLDTRNVANYDQEATINLLRNVAVILQA